MLTGCGCFLLPWLAVGYMLLLLLTAAEAPPAGTRNKWHSHCSGRSCRRRPLALLTLVCCSHRLSYACVEEHQAEVGPVFKEHQ